MVGLHIRNDVNGNCCVLLLRLTPLSLGLDLGRYLLCIRGFNTVPTAEDLAVAKSRTVGPILALRRSHLTNFELFFRRHRDVDVLCSFFCLFLCAFGRIKRLVIRNDLLDLLEFFFGFEVLILRVDTGRIFIEICLLSCLVVPPLRLFILIMVELLCLGAKVDQASLGMTGVLWLADHEWKFD